MLGAQDRTATDALHSFHDALSRAQQALQQEESRLAQLLQSSRAQTAANAELRESLNGAWAQRLEALRREILRVRSLVAQHKAAAAAQQRHIDDVRRPRAEAEAQRDEHCAAAREAQRAYLNTSAAAHARLAQALLPCNGLREREAAAAAKHSEVLALRTAVEELRRRAAESGAEPQPQPQPQPVPRLGMGPQPVPGLGMGPQPVPGLGIGPQPVPGLGIGPQPVPGLGMGPQPVPGLGIGDELSLSSQLEEARVARAALESGAAEDIARLRARRDELRAELRRLCAAVEAADAAQQAAQQEFNAVLNQQSEPRVGCGACGRDVVDSIVAS